MLVALTPFVALVGFRDPRESRDLVAGLAAPELSQLVEALDGSDPERALHAAVTVGLAPGPTADLGRRAELITAVADVASVRSGDPMTPPAAALAYEWVGSLAQRYPADLGALAPLLLNTVVLEPGQALALPPRTLHAYLAGAGVEIMASSDNVLRGGLTTKHVDVTQLLGLLDFHPTPVPYVVPTEVLSGVRAYDSGEPAFRLLQVTCDGRVTVPSSGPRLLLVTTGSLEVRAGSGEVSVACGHAAYIPAAAGPVEVVGVGVAWLAEPGRSGA